MMDDQVKERNTKNSNRLKIEQCLIWWSKNTKNQKLQNFIIVQPFTHTKKGKKIQIYYNI